MQSTWFKEHYELHGLVASIKGCMPTTAKAFGIKAMSGNLLDIKPCQNRPAPAPANCVDIISVDTLEG